MKVLRAHAGGSEEGRTPVFVLPGLCVDPDQTVCHEVLDDSMGPRSLPVEIQLQHGYCDIAKNLYGFEYRALVGIQLLGYTSYQASVPNLHDGEAGSEGSERVYGALDVVIANFHAPAYALGFGYAGFEIRDADKPAVL